MQSFILDSVRSRLLLTSIELGLFDSLTTPCINLQHYYLPSELEREIEQFVEYYNNHRYHESLDNLTPANIYYGRKWRCLSLREMIKLETLKARKAFNLGKGEGKKEVAFKQKFLLIYYTKCPNCSDDLHNLRRIQF